MSSKPAGQESPIESSSNPSTPVRIEQPQSPFFIHHSWRIASIVAVVMVLLALLGVGLATTNAAVAPTYWVSLVPIYGVLCIFTAWSRSRHGGAGQRYLVIRQVLHWLVIGVAIGLDFFIRRAGQETGVAAGLNALMLLAVGCYLAGVHLEWLFALVGVLLTLTLICVTKADQYVWLIFIVGLGAIVAILGLMHLMGGTGAGKNPGAPA